MKNKFKEKFEGRKFKKTNLVKIVVLLVTLSALFIYFFYSNSSSYKGQVESLIIPNVAEVSGKVIDSNISLGQLVKKGETIAVIDSTSQDYSLSQLELGLEKKKLALSETNISKDSQAANSYLAAQASYNNAGAIAEKASKDYEDAKTLYSQGAISGSDLEKSKVASVSASAAKSAALAQLHNTLNEASSSNASLDIALLESQISQAKDQLKKYTLLAPCDGIIISKNYNEGSMISMGYNIADIGSFDETYVVFYLPESEIPKVGYNQVVTLEYKEKRILGKIKYIDVKSQYTPKDLQTSSNKNQTSFKIKALLPPDSNFKPGMEINVTL